MKNLSEELHKLDEYNYKVSQDFSKKVMKQIHKGRFSNQMQYVISFASLAAVVCFAAVLYKNSNLKDRLSENADASQNIAYYDTLDNNVQEDKTEADLESVKDLKDAEKDFTQEDSSNAKEFVNEEEIINSENEGIANTNPAASGTSLVEASRVDLENDLMHIIQNAGFSVEKVESGLKVEANKQELEELLKDRNIELEEQEDGVLIKLP